MKRAKGKKTSRKTCTCVRPSPEDRARIVRLEEEIIGRVEEMARILARVHGRFPRLPVVTFIRREEPGTAATPEVAWHEFTTVDGETGCYDNVHKVSCAGPCPCE